MKILIILSFFFGILNASFKVGSTLPTFEIKSQFNKKIEISHQYLLISFQRDLSKKVKNFLNQKEKDFLDKSKTLYISDIHKMPSFITKWFAIPKMKKYNFRIGLLYDNAFKNFKKEKNRLLVIKLNKNKIIKKIGWLQVKNLDLFFKEIK